MQSLARGVLVRSGYRGANLGLIETQEGVVLVDTPMLPTVAQAWAATVRAHGPVKYIVNTDHLQEHSMGNRFIEGDVVAHEETRDRMRMTEKAREQYRKYVVENDPDEIRREEDFEPRLPNITLFDRLTIYLGERELEFVSLPGHATNNVGLYLPDTHVLFAGDAVVNGYRPYLGLSNIRDWLMTLRAIQVMGVEWVVPGHGEPTPPEGLNGLISYLELMRDRVQTLIDEGRARD
ncbi:MAG TPA: MBL fold metallo-hydrolase, partial [Ardenticatenaceae bacterium]|nr:MBL fold metallo-hydrolase [Ardenticatenaceae bacterium]